MIIEETDVEGMRVESYCNACLLQISRLVGGICDCPICQMISFPHHPMWFIDDAVIVAECAPKDWVRI